MTNPLKILLVDDEAPARARLRDILGDLSAELATVVAAEASDGRAALELVVKTEINVALIDIRMPGIDGIELARHLTRLPTPPAVIFVTAYDQYAVQAFELAAIDYLLKPVRAARLLDALRKAKRHSDEILRLPETPLATRRHLSCLELGRILLVPVPDILFLRADQKYVSAQTAAREYLLEESLVHLETEFAAQFLRVHRNCLVARQAVIGVERTHAREGMEIHWQVILRDTDERPPVSRRLWPQVKSALHVTGQ